VLCCSVYTPNPHLASAFLSHNRPPAAPTQPPAPDAPWPERLLMHKNASVETASTLLQKRANRRQRWQEKLAETSQVAACAAAAAGGGSSDPPQPATPPAAAEGQTHTSPRQHEAAVQELEGSIGSLTDSGPLLEGEERGPAGGAADRGGGEETPSEDDPGKVRRGCGGRLWGVRWGLGCCLQPPLASSVPLSTHPSLHLPLPHPPTHPAAPLPLPRPAGAHVAGHRAGGGRAAAHGDAAARVRGVHPAARAGGGGDAAWGAGACRSGAGGWGSGSAFAAVLVLHRGIRGAAAAISPPLAAPSVQDLTPHPPTPTPTPPSDHYGSRHLPGRPRAPA